MEVKCCFPPSFSYLANLQNYSEFFTYLSTPPFNFFSFMFLFYFFLFQYTQTKKMSVQVFVVHMFIHPSLQIDVRFRFCLFRCCSAVVLLLSSTGGNLISFLLFFLPVQVLTN